VIRTSRNLAIIVVFLGVVGIVIGAVFIGLGVARNNELKEAMRVEHVTLSIEHAETKGQVIDSLEEAQKAGDTVREHLTPVSPAFSP